MLPPCSGKSAKGWLDVCKMGAPNLGGCDSGPAAERVGQQIGLETLSFFPGRPLSAPWRREAELPGASRAFSSDPGPEKPSDAARSTLCLNFLPSSYPGRPPKSESLSPARRAPQFYTPKTPPLRTPPRFPHASFHQGYALSRTQPRTLTGRSGLCRPSTASWNPPVGPFPILQDSQIGSTARWGWWWEHLFHYFRALLHP